MSDETPDQAADQAPEQPAAAEAGNGGGLGDIPDLSAIGPDDFANLVANVTEEQIAQLMGSDARKQVLDEIFKRMTEFVDPARARGTDAIVHFKLLNRPESLGGGYDHYEVVFDDGNASTTDDPQREPNVTIKIDPVDFLKLASNQASGPTLFMTGKLKLEGDVMLASRLTSLFRIPSATG